MILADLVTKKNWYYKNHKRGKKPQTQKVYEYLQENPTKIWWWAWEVIGKKNKSGDFLSHRAPARLTDLVNDGKCVSERIGEYTVYRLK